MARRLTDHVSEHQLHECYQSAYRPHHSTETVLVMVQNDILEAFNDRQGVILVLLDQSAAFDTINNSMLVSRLQWRFDITGVASAWIESNLSGRSRSVVLSGNTSHRVTYHTESHKGQCWALCCSPFIRAQLGYHSSS